MLSLELAALEADGQALTLSQPQILVQEGYTGSIHTGQELSYTVATDDGQQQEWKSAVLGLTVVPRVLPKNQVQLDLVVVQDSIGDLLPNGQLSLNTHKLETRAMVGLGQTLVLGGALYQQQLDRLLSNPAISGLPFVGQWFANEQTESERLELLIFVTPRIVNP
jgi:type IV pilus assembly protein PilQ